MSAPPDSRADAEIEVEVGDHLRADTDGPVQAGTYRVVGTAPDDVTVLEVRDASGHRVNSGRIATLDRRDLDRLSTGKNPDTGWGKVRKIPQQYAAHPLETMLSVALLGYALAVEMGVPGLPGSFQDTAVLIAVFVLGFMALRA